MLALLQNKGLPQGGSVSSRLENESASKFKVSSVNIIYPCIHLFIVDSIGSLQYPLPHFKMHQLIKEVTCIPQFVFYIFMFHICKNIWLIRSR